MPEETALAQLIDSCFLQLASPIRGNGLYSTIDSFLRMAYTLGKTGEVIDTNKTQHTYETVPAGS